MSVVTIDDLTVEDPSEVEASDSVEEKRIDDVNSPFANMLRTLAAGGGRSGRNAGVRNTPVIEGGRLCGQNFEELRAQVNKDMLAAEPLYHSVSVLGEWRALHGWGISP